MQTQRCQALRMGFSFAFSLDGGIQLCLNVRHLLEQRAEAAAGSPWIGELWKGLGARGGMVASIRDQPRQEQRLLGQVTAQTPRHELADPALAHPGLQSHLLDGSCGKNLRYYLVISQVHGA